MAEDKISLAVLINNENIPTDIFSSSVDKYFGPQIEDFKNSSLIVCILSDSTGWIPSENNVATYIKSQWLFTTTLLEDKNFEFKVAICDNQNWNVIANEDRIGMREIKTMHIESDKVILIRISWNEEYTFSIESLTDLYSMDESFIKSHYECPDIFETDNKDFLESIQNLQTIKEDDDDLSLNDSLQDKSKNEGNFIMHISADSLQEKADELENDSLGNSQNNINIQSEQDDLENPNHTHEIVDEDSKNVEIESLQDSLYEFNEEFSQHKRKSEIEKDEYLKDSQNDLNEPIDAVVDVSDKEITNDNKLMCVGDETSLIKKPENFDNVIEPFNEKSEKSDIDNYNELNNFEPRDFNVEIENINAIENDESSKGSQNDLNEPNDVVVDVSDKEITNDNKLMCIGDKTILMAKPENSDNMIEPFNKKSEKLDIDNDNGKKNFEPKGFNVEIENINVIENDESSKGSQNDLNEPNDTVIDVSDEEITNYDKLMSEETSLIAKTENSNNMIEPFNENSEKSNIDNDNENTNFEQRDSISKIPTSETQNTNTQTLKDKKAARMSKVQSLFGVKSELQEIKKRDMESIIKNKKTPFVKYEEDYETENTINIISDCLQCPLISTVIESPSDEIISILDPHDIHVAESTMSIIGDNVLPENELEPPTRNEIFDCDVTNKITKNEFKVGIISDEYCENEYISPIDDQVQANVEFVESIDFGVHKTFDDKIDETVNETDDEENNGYKNAKPLQSIFLIENNSEIFNEKCIDSNEILITEIENSVIPLENIDTISNNGNVNIDDDVIIEENTDDLSNLISVISSDEESPKDSNLNQNSRETDDDDAVLNNCKDSNSEDITIIQPKVEDVVEMFEKLVLKEEEPLKCSKRYKTENDNFILIKQKFESENKDNNEINSLNNNKDDTIAHQIDDILINEEVEIDKYDKEFKTVNENLNRSENHQLNESLLEDEKNENKENQSLNNASNINASSIKLIQCKNDITEINDLSRNLSLKDIKRIVNEKREKLAVNDDYKYPDSVTPTKVEHSLSKSPEYNVPFMDDESFYNESWYEESDDRWTSLDRPIVNNQERLLLTHASNSQTPETSKASTEVFKEIEEERPQMIDKSIKKEPKRKGLISLCGCVGGR